jgi:hypothetical protein
MIITLCGDHYYGELERLNHHSELKNNGQYPILDNNHVGRHIDFLRWFNLPSSPCDI